ncbi:SRPBCC domain-containing protein [Glycomyces sp. NPDC046736]|uniref:SRPBCC family protein n=1 Tax=Glycomyces sp. NPDC046736 TaxID=3155615 RepID=UPI0033C0CA5C
MSLTGVDKDFDNLTVTMTADFDSPVEEVWRLWADPRKLERWWGPPTYPATFERHELRPGGEVVYFMTSPEGEKYYGWWNVTDVHEPHSLSFTDGFGDGDGKPNPDLPTTSAAVRLSERDGGTRMVLVSTFASREAMQQLDEMGMTEGMSLSIGQMDALLAE